MGGASQLSSEGLDLWRPGDRVGAEEKTRAALALLPADHWANSYVRGQLAGILDALGRRDEARDEYSPDDNHALSFVEAQALLLLGRRKEAIEAARQSIAASKTDELRERIRTRLAELGLTQD